MKNLLSKTCTFVMVLIFWVGCERPKKESTENPAELTGGFGIVFFDVKDTTVRVGNADSVARITKRAADVNFNTPDAFWPGHQNFFMYALGAMDFPEKKAYSFRLESRGKVRVAINNKEVFKITSSGDSKMDNTAHVEKGRNVFEIEYFDAGVEPKVVLYWSRDGQNFEVMPSEMFSDADLNYDAGAYQKAASRERVSDADLNSLSKEETADGWKLLFDGKSTKGWHTYNKPGSIGRKWIAQDGALTFTGRDRFRFEVDGRMIEMGDTDKTADGGLDIVSDGAYSDFELKLQWKISEGGNSGIFYTVIENPQYSEVWKTSPEMQVLDDAKHKDGLIYSHKAGDLYDLIACSQIAVRPAGEWNDVKIVKNKGRVEHWLNGVKVVEYDLKSQAWNEMIARSKFSTLKEYGTAARGRIGLQDHDNMVSFRNMKIRELK